MTRRPPVLLSLGSEHLELRMIIRDQDAWSDTEIADLGVHYATSRPRLPLLAAECQAELERRRTCPLGRRAA